jgi:hypothetical protein
MTRRKPASLTRKECRGNVDYVIGQILRENPGITETESYPMFRNAVLKDAELVEACMFWCHQAARDRACKDVDVALTLEEKRRRRELKKRERDARVAELYERAKTVLILNHPMPNGLPLRDCTFAYAKEVGGAFARIGDMGDPDRIIGDVLSDDEADAAFDEPAVVLEGPAHRAGLGQLKKAG